MDYILVFMMNAIELTKQYEIHTKLSHIKNIDFVGASQFTNRVFMD